MDVGAHYNEEMMISDLRQYFPEDTSDKQILEIAENPHLLKEYMNQLENYYKEVEANYSVYEECIVPVVQQSFESVWLLLLYCLILRFLCMLKTPKPVLHIASFVFGCLSLWKFYNELLVHIIVPVVVIVILCKMVRIPGLLVAALTGSYMLACEYFILSSVDWTKIKGSVMIVFMKVISIAFDQESGVIEHVSLLEYFGYIFNPASVIFGPFITIMDYQQFLKNKKFSFSWLLNCIKVLSISLFCLSWSSCGTTHYLPRVTRYLPILEDNRWWKAFYEAQQFRFSHYFVCYLSEACCLLMGVGTLVAGNSSKSKNNKVVNDNKKTKKPESKEDDEKKENNNELAKVSWRRPVANLSIVEFPRSLVGVVTNWNLPMHYWLKQYIFKSTRQFGVFAAILITYFASAMLHGLNFQLSAVLLSIGVFAYIESVFRHGLATTFSACIEARKCQKDCQHKYKKNNFWVIVANLFFALIAMWNLAYLGCLFDSSEAEVEGYSMTHALNKWKQYNYMNHVTMMCVLITQKLFLR